MAAVSEERAQLLLAGAFVLAVALLGLTIVLSAGNYTASLAGDTGTVSQGDDALTARQSVEADLRSHVGIVNARTSSYSAKEDAIEAATGRVADRTSEFYARQGRVVTVGTPSFERGWRIKQTDPAAGLDETFREPDERAAGDTPAETWQLVNDGRVRNMTFHFSQLPRTVDPAFTIQFRQSSGSGPEWNVNIKQTIVSGTTVWSVEVREVGAPSSRTCTRSLSATADETVGFSDALMDGRYCPALDGLEMESNQYDIFVRTEDPGVTGTTRQFARGNFWLIVTQGDGGSPIPGPSGGSAGTVETDKTIYSTTVPFAFRSSAVRYEADLRVAPGEIE